MARTFEGSPSALLLVGEDGVVRAVNGAAERLFGHGRDQLVGAPVERLVPDRFRARHPALFRSYFAAPTVRLLGNGSQMYGRRADGSEVPVEIGLSPIADGQGRFVLASIIDVSARLRGEELLRASVLEKDTLLREIHHRVKNNLQVVSSLLSLQAGRLGVDADRGAFEDCQGRVQVMALVHEKLYSAGNLSSLDARSYLKDLVRLIVRSNDVTGDRVAVHAQFAAVALDLVVAVPVGIILHELPVNAQRHAVGVRRVNVRASLVDLGDGQLELAVRDDGVGLPDGFDPEQTRGLGLRLVSSLVRQIDGRFRWGSGAGAWFELCFRGASVRRQAPVEYEEKGSDP